MVGRFPFSSSLQPHIMWELGISPVETMALDKGLGRGMMPEGKGGVWKEDWEESGLSSVQPLLQEGRVVRTVLA